MFGIVNSMSYICGMKNQLPYCKTSEAIKGYSESSIAKNETNDCVVKSIASGFEIDYDRAHQIVKEQFNRKDKKGTFGFIPKMNSMSESRERIGRKCFQIMGKKSIYGYSYSLSYNTIVKGEIVKRQMTVGTFIKKHPKGTFIVCVKSHAFTIKDGVVIGNKEDAIQKRKIIQSAWKVGS